VAFKDEQPSGSDPLGVRVGSSTMGPPAAGCSPSQRAGEGGSRCLEQGLQRLLVGEGESTACDRCNG